MQYLDINIDYSRDELFDEIGIKTLKDRYMKSEENSPQERFAFVAKTFGSDRVHSQRLYDYLSKHWLSAATPILSYGRSSKGLPISCFLNYVEDTSASLVDKLSETNRLSMAGGGVGTGFGIRSKDEKSTGVMPHLKIYDASMLAYRQGKTRRGSYATYLDISHPDIVSFVDMKRNTGDENIRCNNLNFGVNISDEFMQLIEKLLLGTPGVKDEWPLIDPATKLVKKVVSAKELWQNMLLSRMQHGEPYMHFQDTSNAALPQFLKDKGLKIHHSNLCTEIMLPTAGDRTAICCLSSVNLGYYDDWKDRTLFLSDVAEMLDNVLTIFLRDAPPEFKDAVYSGTRERSIGIGVLGFHDYLQSKSIAFESAMAKSYNIRIFKDISSKLNEANLTLGSSRGEAPDAVGTGQRFSHMMAIAPTASTSIIMGNISPSIEPYKANVYRQDTQSGMSFNKNRHLEKLLKKKCEENPELIYDDIWTKIIKDDGSCQDVECLTQEEKDIFKTALEIDQQWIVEHAADRQPFIDQGQSVNLFFRPTVHKKYLSTIHFLAWKRKLKSLYYCRSEKIATADKLGEKNERRIIEESNQNLVQGEECLACQ